MENTPAVVLFLVLGIIILAARLGGSKATLYAYFKSKEELFKAIITEQCDQIHEVMDAEADDGDVRQALTNLGMKLGELLFSDMGNRTLQLVVEESERSPELAELFNIAGPEAGERRMAEFMARAKARGALDVPDPLTAARQFIALIKGDLHFKRLLSMIPQPSEAQIRREVDAAVAMFMRAYGPRTEAGPAAG
jgi:AcrR family transcriptional regulator